jgi:diguanylate cyclase (GGDEF)-like protein
MASLPQIESPTPPQVDASFTPYVRLLKMLMPSLSGIIVHDGAAELIWMSEDWEVAGVDAVVQEAIAGASAQETDIFGLSRGVDSDHWTYSFAIRRDRKETQGVVTLAIRMTGARSEARPLPYVQQLVQPVLECLKRELTLRESLGSRERDLNVRERDLSLIMQISQRGPGIETDADPFEQVYSACIENLGCSLVAMWVPEKNIAASRSRGGQPVSVDVLARTEKHLMSWMQLQQRTLIMNRTAKQPGDSGAPYKILACPIRNQSDRVIGVLALFNPPGIADFNERHTRIAELLAKKAAHLLQSQYDPSTGLLTRQAFERQAKALFATGGPIDRNHILYLDIDRLHVINETFGMHTGDEIIGSVADAVFKALPVAALSARISGDRLAVLLPNSDMDQAASAAEKVRAAAAAVAPRKNKGGFDVSVSVGVAPVSKTASPLAHALALAEVACKAAKDRGRNRVELFQDSDQSIIRRHTDILVVGDLRSALESGRFRLDAQPILPLRGNYGRPRFELLLRMIGEKGEIIPPAKFLSSAERYQMMPLIDRWVVHHACSELGRRKDALGDEAARFAINLSGQSLCDETFLEFVVNEVKASGLPPGTISFELTETATIGNLESAQEFMRTMQNLGCQFALDDFGTGVSSLAYLKALSVSYLKIDGSFVRDAMINPRSESMIKAIAQLAKVMCMETIAEYVETDALRARMADLGVDYGQGFAIGRPQPLSDLLGELAIYEATVSTWVAPMQDNLATAIAS